MDSKSRLDELRTQFLAESTQSMPIAGMIFWAIVAAAALRLNPNQLVWLVGCGSGAIFPLGLLIDRLTGRKIRRANAQNPVTQLFLRSLALVALLWPFVIIAAWLAHNPNLVVLGAAILMGIIWIPYGWAADDPVGLQHAIGRCVLCYVAYLFAPNPYKATTISVIVLLAYAYSFVRMRKPPAEAPAR
jgi:hypothetical protein